MKHLLLILSALYISSSFSCKKKEIIKVDPPIEETLIVVWKTQFPNDSLEYISIDPILTENSLISSYSPINSTITNEKIISYNKDTGVSLWTWDEYIRPAPQKVSGTSRIYLIENTLTACSSQDNYAIDINTGQTLWATNIEDGNPRTNLFNDLLFHTITYGTAPYGDSTKIIGTNVNEGIWKDIFSIAKTDEFEVHFEPPSGYINDDSDTLLIFQNRQINLISLFENVDIYCYNMTADSIEWIIENATSSGSSNVNPPIIENGLAFFGGKWDFLCIDIITGDIIWNHNFYWDFQGSNFLIYHDLIITNLDNGDLIAIDKHTGNQVWVNEGLSYCCADLRVFEDRIYFGNDKLYIVDAGSGELLYKFKSPNPGGSFINAISVDLANNKMYTSDGRYMMCMELPE